jgi:hypothetical protein
VLPSVSAKRHNHSHRVNGQISQHDFRHFIPCEGILRVSEDRQVAGQTTCCRILGNIIIYQLLPFQTTRFAQQQRALTLKFGNLFFLCSLKQIYTLKVVMGIHDIKQNVLTSQDLPHN